MDFYLAIDPSLRSTGVAITDSAMSSIQVRNYPKEKLEHKSFVFVYERACEILRDMRKDFLDKTEGSEIRVLMEIAPPVGQWAVGLTILDTVLYDYFVTRTPPVTINIQFPIRIHSLAGGRRSKAQLRRMAFDLLETNEVVVTGTDGEIGDYIDMRYDESDALLLLFYLYHNWERKVILPEPLSEKRWVWKER